MTFSKKILTFISVLILVGIIMADSSGFVQAAVTADFNRPTDTVPTTRFSLLPCDPLNKSVPHVSISLTLPIYPNSREEKGTSNPEPDDLPIAYASYTLYKGCSNAFLIPLSMQDARKWFTHQLTSIGYSRSPSCFKKNKSPDVYVTYTQKDATDTIVQYFGKYMMRPPRPAASLLPNNITEIDVDYTSDGTLTSNALVIKNSRTIHKLVKAVNKMAFEPPPHLGHPAILVGTKYLEIKFLTSTGDTYILAQDVCYSFLYGLNHNSETFSLEDPSNAVSRLIKLIIFCPPGAT